MAEHDDEPTRPPAEAAGGPADMDHLREALQHSEERYRALMEQSLLGIMITHATPPRFGYVSDGFAQMLGFPAERLLAMSAEEVVGLIHPEDLEQALAPYEALLTGKVTQAETLFRFLRSDGVPRWLKAVGSVVSFEGAPAVQSLCSDVTERVEAERALRRSEAKYRLLAEHSSDIIWTMNLDFVAQYVSPSEARLRGLPRDVVRRQSLEERMTPESAQRARMGLQMALQAERAGKEAFPVTGEMDLVHADGHTIPTETTVNLIRDDDGRPTGLLGVTRDISRRHQLEQERLALEAQVQRAQKLESLGVLVGGIAHDFNNLLHAFMTNLALVRQHLAPDSPAQSRAQDMETAVRRAADLCRQMLVYAGKGRVVAEEVDLNAVVKEMSGLLGLSVGAGAELELRLAEELPRVMADPTQLRQVVLNLVTNAAEAIEEGGGTITLTTELRRVTREELGRSVLGGQATIGTFLSLEVADTGVGMTPETVEKMFEPFFSTKFAGRGLGLAAVLGIVRAHQGVLQVESEPGKGTRCRVLIPQIARTPRPQTAPAEAASPADVAAAFDGAGRAVLVVDDDRLSREGLELLLGHFGFDVVSAPGGREALERFRERPDGFAVVLLDLTMPDMDGVETFRELRRLRGDLPVVLCSGYGVDEVVDRFDGGDDQLAGFLHKPYDPGTLLAKLREVLG